MPAHKPKRLKSIQKHAKDMRRHVLKSIHNNIQAKNSECKTETANT